MGIKRTLLLSSILVISLILCFLVSKSQVLKKGTTDSNLVLNNDSLQLLVTKKLVVSKILVADTMINFGKKYLGLKYKRGGITNRGYDCSGYTMTVFAKFGVRLPHTSAGQALIGIDVNTKNIKKGDLIFFKGSSRRKLRIGHVGIVISEKGEPIKFIHSSVSEGVREDWLTSAYYQKRFVKAVRVVDWVQ